jgi:prepilin-type N-terminal cleavage/methylation domain-containing protein
MNRPSTRTAFTLLELILVMALIVSLMAIGYPMIESSYAYVKVTAAADTVKGAWARARARAIEDCIAYRFSIAPEQGRFRIAPDRADYWTGDGVPDPGQNNPPLVLEGKLPKGIAFAPGQNASNDSPASSNDDEKVNAANWVTTAVFLPDGTAQDDVDMKINIKGTRPITLRLRSMTGTAKTIVGEENR